MLQITYESIPFFAVRCRIFVENSGHSSGVCVVQASSCIGTAFTAPHVSHAYIYAIITRTRRFRHRQTHTHQVVLFDEWPMPVAVSALGTVQYVWYSIGKVQQHHTHRGAHGHDGRTCGVLAAAARRVEAHSHNRLASSRLPASVSTTLHWQ